MFELKVTGSTGREYTIKQGRDGVVYCSCPSWKFNSRNPAQRDCKHVRQVARQFQGQLAQVG